MGNLFCLRLGFPGRGGVRRVHAQRTAEAVPVLPDVRGLATRSGCLAAPWGTVRRGDLLRERKASARRRVMLALRAGSAATRDEQRELQSVRARWQPALAHEFRLTPEGMP